MVQTFQPIGTPFSTELNPNWSTYLVSQPEIQAYWEKKYKLKNHTHLSTIVKYVEWDKENMNDKVTMVDGNDNGNESIVRAKVMIWAIGGFFKPMFLKELKGSMGRFKGMTWHSARWRHDIELKRKRVGIIGNGCSV